MLNYYNTGVTVELGQIVDSGVDIWAFEYPTPAHIVDYNGKEAHTNFDKKAFEQKVIDHYRFRQIGFETVGRFLHYFRARIREIMPYYVQLYEFDAKFRNIEDPLESYNLVETFHQETSGSGTVDGKTTGLNKYSDTPQGEVENLDRYMTNANQGEGTNYVETSDGGTTDHTITRRGNIGVQPLGGEVENIRKAFINIDQMIIQDLNDLFMQVY